MGLSVTSRTSAFALGEKDLSIPEIANRLGVTHIVEGSVRKQGNRVRITGQLIEVAGDTHLWSDTYDGELTDIFRLQDDIANQISDALSARLNIELPETTLKRPDVDVSAYDLFLRARELIVDRGFDSLQEAVKLLEAAVAIEPDYTDAWAEMGAAQILIAWNYNQEELALETAKAAEAAREAAEKATMIDPDHSAGLSVRGLFHLNMGDFLKSRILLDRAVAQPNATVNAWLWSGIHYLEMGFFEQAIKVLTQGLKNHPNAPNIKRWLFTAHNYNNQRAEGLKFVDNDYFNDDSMTVFQVKVSHVKLGELSWQDFTADFDPDSFLSQLLDLSEQNFDSTSKNLIDQTLKGSIDALTNFQLIRLSFFSQSFAPMAFNDVSKSLVERMEVNSFTPFNFSIFWMNDKLPVRSSDMFLKAMQDRGLVEVWELYGWPKYCEAADNEYGLMCF